MRSNCLTSHCGWQTYGWTFDHCYFCCKRLSMANHCSGFNEVWMTFLLQLWLYCTETSVKSASIKVYFYAMYLRDFYGFQISVDQARKRWILHFGARRTCYFVSVCLFTLIKIVITSKPEEKNIKLKMFFFSIKKLVWTENANERENSTFVFISSRF